MADRIGSPSRSGLVATKNVNRMLQKSPDEVFAFSSDGQTYTAPKCLIGTPVRKITENGDYWKSGWLSLESFFAQEENEKKAKAEAYRRRQLNPSDKRAAHEYKIHSDNVCKHKKTREIFGPETNYHPNQLVSKHHLPADGLCHIDIMYKLACKISDLKYLQDRRELAMDPWDFIRWRVALKLQPKLLFAAQSGREYVRTIISQIFEGPGTESSPRPYYDPLLRAAIIRSAGYQGRLNSYGKPSDKRKVVKRPSTTTSRIRPANLSRVEKRQKISSQPSTYHGVNAFRAQQQTRRGSLDNPNP
ncbi:acyl- thioesterase ii [Fusarium langsethiae]|uniref:Acyl-thioesterase ii n=1 Tax=Fusarium langsethiae TaxID=179993 RepID=A0A0M9F3M5_FUSLA|nr:acyl- thioesterase ii [Fusarium langsethiae]GKT99236.1 unnamed protein product [Fusarium langsethiae]GKU17081.1 unnamed protein product [Fusarium langsethiae]